MQRGTVVRPSNITVYDDSCSISTAIQTTVVDGFEASPETRRTHSVSSEPRSNTMKLGAMKAQSSP
jgi:hypothetical protein